MKKLYLLGYSGHALVVADCVDVSKVEIHGYFDRQKNDVNPLNLEYFGSEKTEDFVEIVKNDFVFPALGSNTVRKSLVEYLETKKVSEISLIHPTAFVSSSAKIGLSTLIAPKAIINAMATVGKGAIVNSGAIVEHECSIGDFAHIAPGAVLAGNVQIGEETFVGANVTVKQGITIGKGAIIGAGSVVLENIGDGEMWAGIPAKKIKDLE